MENISFDENGPEEQSSHSKRKKQLIWAGVGLAAIVLAVIGWQYWQYINSDYYRQMKTVEEFEKFYADDDFGGKTPEETLAMFLDAVKKEDFELASQYATKGSGDNIKKWLNGIKAGGQLQEFIKAYSTAVKEDGVSSDVQFSIYENGGVVSNIAMDKNSKGVWKITE